MHGATIKTINAEENFKLLLFYAVVSFIMTDSICRVHSWTDIVTIAKDARWKSGDTKDNFRTKCRIVGHSICDIYRF
jgi:hypothetical protein